MARKHFHFAGIGGIGMSALAQILSAQGVRVSGCDLKSSLITVKLERYGVVFFQGHDPRHLEDVDALVYSSAISASPELAAARSKGMTLYPRGKLLAEMVNPQFGIAVCGAHGKTTTTSLIATLLKECGLEPTFLIGGQVENLGGNAGMGKGEIWVIEADESDGSFLELMPQMGIVTNIDREHLDFYKSNEDIDNAYRQFIQHVCETGVVIVCTDDPWIRELLKKMKGHWTTYGIVSEAEIQARNIQLFPLSSEFDLFRKGRFLTRAKINLPGEHNILNALAAFTVGIEVGLSPEQMAAGILPFHGVGRRFQIKNRDADIWVIDDYAHHPTEIAATLRTINGLKRKRTIGIFQPHRYTRTQFLLEEFSRVLQKVEHLILTEIYSASESPIQGISGRQLYEKVVEYGHTSCEFINKEEIAERLLSLAKPGDTLLFLGAGDITKVADEVAEKLG
jgi:UDP-N-acetylmuramate--alanine ligase